MTTTEKPTILREALGDVLQAAYDCGLGYDPMDDAQQNYIEVAARARTALAADDEVNQINAELLAVLNRLVRAYDSKTLAPSDFGMSIWRDAKDIIARATP